MIPIIFIASLIVLGFNVLAFKKYFAYKEDLNYRGGINGYRLILAGLSIAFVALISNVVARYLADLAQVTEEQLQNAGIIYKYTFPVFIIIAGSITLSGAALLIKILLTTDSEELAREKERGLELDSYTENLAEKLNTHRADLEESENKLKQAADDLTKVRVAQQESENKFSALFNESPVFFAVVNNKLIICDINEYGAKHLGFRAKSLEGKSFSKIVSKHDQLDSEIFIANFFAQAEPKKEIEVRIQRRGRTEQWFRLCGQIISQDDEEERLLLVGQEVSIRKKLEKELKFQINHDSLTGLMNRYAMEEYLQKLLDARTDHDKHPLALIYFDVDQLKVVNDTCGHAAGDQLLLQLTTLVKVHLEPGERFARMGGDEFAIIKTLATKEEALETASKVRNIAEDFTFTWEDKTFRQSVSLGVIVSSKELCTPTAIFGSADAACYAAKEAGRNRTIFMGDTQQEPGHDNRNKMLWVSRLQEGLLKDRFELYFQPITQIDPSSNNYIHYEILIRYVNDSNEHILPNDFLPAAERFGLSDQIDLWVLTSTLDFLNRHPEHTKALSCCSVNLTSHSLASYRTRSAIRQLVNDTDFPTNKICFEITETSAIQNLEEVADFINDLKALGCRFALDDFGTGFSSFGYLKNLDVDYIKIDGSFIRDIISDKADRAIVTAINTMGREMGIDVVAEYVHNSDVLSELSNLHIPYGQGFGLAKPMPLNQVESYYAMKQNDFRLVSKAT